ncbi:anhydro-N-acetylmuramic acid kinase [Komagataeibacter oboediens]|uniref:Anhydro-N-acetylmuramic acid kinase n=1 Tax=Komagataeibacter xylinus NBRC 13693 TaxID=1234668 RepID=A0A0D6Q9R7_KOMXY|nr:MULTISPECIES: anhydro-N-acetylmuramic acid kinase [Komagataeibacter]WEQ51677.1 anhydro-N-acetylmuramic acid kinase [Komagataeibacter oboediens]GAO00248.1 anhydro-N-acetylmuramic acid kinase [Komagataeibacter xylinus NBRC 13693]
MTRMLNVIGLMSGTSLDGVDAAVIRTDGERIDAFGPDISLPYPAPLRQRARRILDRAPDLPPDDPELGAVEHALTLHHVDAVRRLQAVAPDIDLIGFHGQTILHAPDRHRTWQIGDAALLSRATGLAVIHDFRSADVAAGGEGAPLVPWFHAALLHDVTGPVAVLNIGGVANITLIDADRTIHACDTGPGNALLDDWALRHTGTACDVDGKLAAMGTVNHALLEQMLADPYFARPAPKSLDRQTFATALERVSVCTPADGAATLAAFTVEAVRRTPLPVRPMRWYVCGGGRHNPVLMHGLRVALGVPVGPVDQLGWNGDALEAQCFAFLAVRSLRGLPLSAPTVTGGPHALSGGRLTCAGLMPVPSWIWKAGSIEQATPVRR